MDYILAIVLLTVYFMIGVFLAKWSFLGDGATNGERLYIAITWPLLIFIYAITIGLDNTVYKIRKFLKGRR